MVSRIIWSSRKPRRIAVKSKRSTKLLPCPFCGSVGAYILDNEVCCGGCGAYTWGDDDDGAIAAANWNRRVK